jgi:hypothetical protein
MDMTKFKDRLAKFKNATGITGKGLNAIDHADLMGVLSPTIQMTDKPPYGPTLSIDRGGRTSILPRTGSQEFSAGDRAMMKALDLSEEDYKQHLGQPGHFEQESREKISISSGEKVKLSDKERIDSALGLSAQDYIDFG